MSRTSIERRLTETSAGLKRARAELAVADEHLALAEDAASDADLRALVAETPIAARDAAEARKQAGAMARGRADAAARVAELERTLDRLLDRLAVEAG